MIDFDQYTEYVDTAGVHHVALEQHALDALLTLDALRDGYAHATALGHDTTLTAAEFEAVQAAAPYHADVVAAEIVGTNPATIVANLIAVRSRPWWYVGLHCVAADAERTIGVYFNPANANLYRCVLAHIAQPDWRPDLPGLGALWVRFYEPEAGPQEWVQPTGAHDAYALGALALHNGLTWRSLYAANVWEPGVFGWEIVA